MNKSDQAMDRAPEEPSSASTAPETSATTSATTKMCLPLVGVPMPSGLMGASP